MYLPPFQYHHKWYHLCVLLYWHSILLSNCTFPLFIPSKTQINNEIIVSKYQTSACFIDNHLILRDEGDGKCQVVEKHHRLNGYLTQDMLNFLYKGHILTALPFGLVITDFNTFFFWFRLFHDADSDNKLTKMIDSKVVCLYFLLKNHRKKRTFSHDKRKLTSKGFV